MRKKNHITVELWFTRSEIKKIDELAAKDNRKRKPYLELMVKKIIKSQ